MNKFNYFNTYCFDASKAPGETPEMLREQFSAMKTGRKRLIAIAIIMGIMAIHMAMLTRNGNIMPFQGIIIAVILAIGALYFAHEAHTIKDAMGYITLILSDYDAYHEKYLHRDEDAQFHGPNTSLRKLRYM